MYCYYYYYYYYYYGAHETTKLQSSHFVMFHDYYRVDSNFLIISESI